MKNIVPLIIILCSVSLFGCSKKNNLTAIDTTSIKTEIMQHKEGHRHGERPETTDAPMNTNIAHQQINQNSPKSIQEELWNYMSSLSGAVSGPTRISVSGARSLFIPGTIGPTIAGDERVHLHPSHDGSLHIALDKNTMEELVQLGRGEFHPRNKNSIMLYGPRDQEELIFVKDVLKKGLELHTTKNAKQYK